MAEDTEGVTLRQPGPAEWQVLREIRLRALVDAPDAFGSTLERELAFDEAMWRSRCVTSVNFLAECDGVPVGLVGAFRPPSVDGGAAREPLELVSMWVAPEFRCRGIGARLVAEVLALARREQQDAVMLWVAAGNDAATSLYEKLGFVRTGATDTLPGRPDKCEERMRFEIERAGGGARSQTPAS